MVLFTPPSINFVLRCGALGVGTGGTRGVGAGTRGIGVGTGGTRGVGAGALRERKSGGLVTPPRRVRSADTSLPTCAHDSGSHNSPGSARPRQWSSCVGTFGGSFHKSSPVPGGLQLTHLWYRSSGSCM